MSPSGWSGDTSRPRRPPPGSASTSLRCRPTPSSPIRRGAWKASPCWSAATRPGPSPSRARYQVPLRDLTPGGSGDPHQTGVEPLHFSGPFFGWPLLDVEWLRAGNWEFDAAPEATGGTTPAAQAPVSDEDDPDDGSEPLGGPFQEEGKAFGHPVRQAVAELNGVIAGPALGPRASQGEQTHASLTRIGPVTASAPGDR